MTASVTKIFKNGSAYKQGNVFAANGGANGAGVVNALVYLNGSTDYVELYAYIAAASGGSFAAATTEYTWFNGALVRAA
jgi:hypothetical protein